MCGIAGLLHLDPRRNADGAAVRRMTRMLTHRGPDDEGIHVEGPVELGVRRLKVIDLEGGHQPLSNEDGTVWVSFNGEVFNFEALRRQLAARGHTLRTRCDTEVIVHLYEDEGDRLVDALNGQFAFALWDGRRRRLLLARDRLGIRPLFYSVVAGTLYFASEIKALLANPEVEARLDPEGLEQVFVYGAPAAPRTCFAGIHQLDSGQLVSVEGGRIERRTYWDLDFPAVSEGVPDEGEEVYARRLEGLFREAVSLQLVADVPVGVYLSGGIDSSVLAGMAGRLLGGPFETFSITFSRRYFDESRHSRAVAAHLGTEHHELAFTDADIVAGLPSTVYFAEHPMLITEMVPLLALARRARERVTVALSGEGADEAFGGYSYFRIDKVRRALAHFPLSLASPLVRWIARWSTGTDVVFPDRATVRRVEEEYGCYPAMAYEFAIGRSLRRMLLSPDLSRQLDAISPGDDLGLAKDRLRRWHPLDQSTYLATRLRLRDLQVSPLGDRATMASSLEGRYPFLDHRIVEFAARLPHHYRLRGLNEKHILRRALGHLVPPAIARRRKQPFMAPMGTAILAARRGSWVEEMLDPAMVRQKGYFQPEAVERVVAGLERYAREGIDRVDYERVLVELGLVGILTVHLFDEMYLKGRGRGIGEFVQTHPRLPWYGAPHRGPDGASGAAVLAAGAG